MARTTLDLVDPRIAKALSHPMRARILVILNDRVASPNEISVTIDERLPNVSYHVRALLDLGCIELVDTAQRRGAIEHYYRAVVRPFFSDRDWKRLPRSGRQAISDVALQIVWEDVSECDQGGDVRLAPRQIPHPQPDGPGRAGLDARWPPSWQRRSGRRRRSRRGARDG